MIELHTLGDALIKVGEKEIRPTAPMLFAALLYLGMERGRRVPRAALQEMLFPDADERSGAHSLRQLLYKLRQFGAPIESTTSFVSIPAASVNDFDAALAEVSKSPEDLGRISLGFLPGFESRISESFDRWLDGCRSAVTANIRRHLLADLSRQRNSGDSVATERTASALLRLDPLNEEATLALAEVLALTGQKRDAVRLLEQYSAEVGETSPELRVPPNVLRRRIFERLEGGQLRVPLLGRQEELSWLLAQFGRAAGGSPTVTIVWGDAGIGKTRLVQEFAAHLILKNARMESAHCQAHDVERPLGAFIDLVPKLLESRGALGVSPRSMEYLRRIAGDVPTSPDGQQALLPELLTARIKEALADLLLSLASEGPLVLVVEDAHWLDQASLQLLLQTVPERNAPLHLVLTLRYRPRFPEGTRISEAVFVRQLEPLTGAASADLLTVAAGPDCVVDESTRDQCVALGAGNPLFLCTIAEHLRLRGAAPPNQARIADLLRQRIRILDASSLLLLRCVAALGNHGTQARVAACTGMTTESELLALQDVADRGLVIRQDGAIKCSHDLLTEVVLTDAPAAIRVAIYERVASVLEQDGSSEKQVNLLWSCAESWRLAENRERAARVLKRCAGFAMEIGQPVFACLALERAQELTDETERLPLVEESIRVAELAFDSEAVLRNVARYRLLQKRSDRVPLMSPDCDLAEINALRRSGKPFRHYMSDLRGCALNGSVSTNHRVKAARLFLHAAEQDLAQADAVDFYSALDDLRGSEETSADWLHLRMIYNCCFGDMAEAEIVAETLLTTMRRQDEMLRVTSLGNIGVVLFRSGAIHKGLDVLHENVLLAEKLSMPSTLAIDSVRLSDAYLQLDDEKNASVWHERAERYCSADGIGYLPPLAAHRIEVALRKGDPEVARRELASIRSQYVDIDAPFATRVYVGFEILINSLEGTLTPESIDLVGLERWDELGRQACGHEHFARALWTAYVACGQPTQATARINEYVSLWRRERYPLPSFLYQIVSASPS